MIQSYLNSIDHIYAFNIWDIASARAVMDAAAETSEKVILQTSTNIYKTVMPDRLREFVTGYQKDLGIKTWLHLDHCKDIAIILDAIDRGWDSVMIDASSLPIDENIRLTNEVTDLAHRKEVPVEAEIGQIKGVEDDIETKRATVASKRDIDTFLKNTDVDMIAVAFGNSHGEYKTAPELHYDIVEYTTSKTDIPFVVHGASGLSDESITRLLGIKGVKKINISTDVKLAYLAGIKEAEKENLLNEDSFQAIKVQNVIHESIKKLVMHKMRG